MAMQSVSHRLHARPQVALGESQRFFEEVRENLQRLFPCR